MVKYYKYCLFTYSPRVEEFENYICSDDYQKLLKWLKKNCIVWLLSYEKGHGETVNHFHCFCEFKKEKRSDKIKFDSFFNMEDYEGREKIAFNRVLIDTEHYIKYYYGYCLKEDCDKFGVFYKDESLYLDYYNECVKKNTIDKEKKRISKKNIPMVVYNYVVFHNIECPKSKEDVCSIFDRMFQDDYILFSIVNKRSIDEYINMCYDYLRYKMKGEPIKYFTDLYLEFLRFND